MQREVRTGVPQGFILSPTLYNMYINDAPETLGVYLAMHRYRYTRRVRRLHNPTLFFQNKESRLKLNTDF
jgi:hypothetical protein